jgi:replication-associated recombination protein RarA
MPLAQTQRPNKLTDFIGQPNLVGPGAPIRQMIESGNLSSMVFWGPPASGKTNASKLMKELDYGKGYVYDHNVEGKKSGQQCMPDKLKSANYFPIPKKY